MRIECGNLIRAECRSFASTSVCNQLQLRAGRTLHREFRSEIRQNHLFELDQGVLDRSTAEIFSDLESGVRAASIPFQEVCEWQVSRVRAHHAMEHELLSANQAAVVTWSERPRLPYVFTTRRAACPLPVPDPRATKGIISLRAFIGGVRIRGTSASLGSRRGGSIKPIVIYTFFLCSYEYQRHACTRL